jgi:hypothetical protein
MSTEKPSESTAPATPAPKNGTIEPDNQFNDILPEAAADSASAVKKPAGPGGVKPDNQFNDSAPKG